MDRQGLKIFKYISKYRVNQSYKNEIFITKKVISVWVLTQILTEQFDSLVSKRRLIVSDETRLPIPETIRISSTLFIRSFHSGLIPKQVPSSMTFQSKSTRLSAPHFRLVPSTWLLFCDTSRAEPELRIQHQARASWLSSRLHITLSCEGMTGIRANRTCSLYTHLRSNPGAKPW